MIRYERGNLGGSHHGGADTVGDGDHGAVSKQANACGVGQKSELSDAKLEAELKKHQAVTDTKIDELTKKVEKHNNMIERTYRLEGEVTQMRHDIRGLKARAG